VVIYKRSSNKKGLPTMTEHYATKVHFADSGDTLQVEAGGIVKGQAGVYTVVADDATANTVDIDTGIDRATTFQIQIRRAGVEVQDAAVASLAAGVLTVADGGTYALTAGDKIHWAVA
jgi:hypothetical protein